MSKGRVWNKGKRNGGGGPPIVEVSKDSVGVNAESSVSGGVIDNKVDRIERVNRENWVSRAAWVDRKKSGKGQVSGSVSDDNGSVDSGSEEYESSDDST